LNDVLVRLDTCFCLVNHTKKLFIDRCRIHLNADYRELLQHNKDNQFATEPDEEKRETQRRTVKETTRPTR